MNITQAQREKIKYLPLIGETITDTTFVEGTTNEEEIEFKVVDVIIAPWQDNHIPGTFWTRYETSKDYESALMGYISNINLEVILLIEHISPKSGYGNTIALPKYLE